MGGQLGRLVLAYTDERRKNRTFAPETARHVRIVLSTYADHVGRIHDPDRITRRQVEQWIASGDVAITTIRFRLSTVRTFSRWLIVNGYARRDPTVGIVPPKEPRRIPRGRRHHEVVAVLAACPDLRTRCIATLMIQMGLRCVEVSRLQVGDIDWDHDTMIVMGKGSIERVLPIPVEAQQAIEAYLAEWPARSGPLVRSYAQPRDGITPGYISSVMSKVFREAGVPGTAHSLRHTFAGDLLRAGHQPRDVQHALGHAVMSSTERYMPHLVGDLRSIMEGRSYRDSGPKAG